MKTFSCLHEDDWRSCEKCNPPKKWFGLRSALRVIVMLVCLMAGFVINDGWDAHRRQKKLQKQIQLNVVEEIYADMAPYGIPPPLWVSVHTYSGS